MNPIQLNNNLHDDNPSDPGISIKDGTWFICVERSEGGKDSFVINAIGQTGTTLTDLLNQKFTDDEGNRIEYVVTNMVYLS